MVAYAAESDVYKNALPRGALGNPGRLVDSALAATSTITLEEHGFALNDQVTVRVPQGGSLPNPLVAGVPYYAIPLTDSTFQVAATSGGSAITLTTDAVSMIVTVDLPWATILEFYSRFVDGFLPAHCVPLTTPYPVTIVGIVCELAARKIQILSGMRSGSMDEAHADAAKQLTRYAAGLPVRDAAATVQPANLSVVKSDRHESWIGRPMWGGWRGSSGGGPSFNPE